MEDCKTGIMAYSHVKKTIRILILIFLAVLYKIFRLFSEKTGPAVLMYHSVSDSKEKFAVHPDVFEKEIAHLKNKSYKFITLKELSGMLSGEIEMNTKSILLTFDDGYGDFMTNALPILRKNNLPAVVFIHTNRSSDNFSNNLPLMDWNDINIFNGSNIEIGNHSHSHSNMKKLSLEELNTDIRLSEETFRKELGFVPKTFAFPGGKYSREVIEVLRTGGYDLAFTIDAGVVMRGDNPLKIKRMGVGNDTSMLEFKIMLTGVSNWYQALRRIKI